MAPTLSLFSRRKPSTSTTAEDDRALRARLSPQLPPTPPPPPPSSTKKHTPHNSISSRSKTDNLTLYPPQSSTPRPPINLVRSSSDASLQMSRTTTRTETPESLASSGGRLGGSNGRRQPPVPVVLPSLSSVNGKIAKRKDSSSSIAFSAISTGSSATGSGYGTLPQNIPLPESIPSTPATATLPLTGGGRAFFGRQLPISPPLSPESPEGLVIGRKRSEADAIHVAALMAKIPPSESDPTRALTSRIAHLESTNNSLTNELSQHSTRITSLLHSHSAVISSLKESHALELSSARTAALASASNELSSLNTRIAQLEYLCESLSNSNPNSAELTQQYLHEQRLRLAAEAATLRAREDLEAVLTSEREHAYMLQEKAEKAEQARITAQHRAKKDLDYVLTEEEKRRAELNWVYGEKMEKIDAQRRKQEVELKKALEQRQTLKTMLEEAQREINALKQTGGGGGGQADRDLLQLNQTLTSRLSSEKTKNKSLENSIASITSTSLATVSTANHEVQKMRNTIEDLTTQNSRLDSELQAITKERNNLNEAWQSAYSELETRDERIHDLESECGELRDSLATRNSELEGARRHAEAQESLFATLSPIEDIGKEMRDLKDDVELYKADIRVYKRDVRKRDGEIKRLRDENIALRKALEEAEGGSGNERASLGMGLISSFPEPSTAVSGLKVENDLLRTANEELRRGSKQQEVLISSLENKLKEKEKEKAGVKRTASRRPKEGGIEVPSGKRKDGDRIVSGNGLLPHNFPLPQLPAVLTAPPPQPPSPEHLTAMLESRPPSYPPPPRPPPKDSVLQYGRSVSSASSSDGTMMSTEKNRSSDGRGNDERRTMESPLPPPPPKSDDERNEGEREGEGEIYEW